MRGVLLGLFLIFGSMGLVSCGYKPLSYGMHEELGDKIFVEVKIDPRDPQNSVTLKDEISKSIFKRLQSNIVDKDEATSIIEVQLHHVFFAALAENRTGFATSYRCEVNVEFRYKSFSDQKMHIFHKKGFYNFSLNETSIITDSTRLEAINYAVLNALDGFISQIGINIH